MSSSVANGPAVVCFVARSGTGKTTLLEKLIPRLKARGLRVGVLKHHAHATAFDVPGKDSYRMAQAGADIVVGACAAQVAIFYPANGPPDLEALIARHLHQVDLVLVEGYKESSHPKIEVCRAAHATRDERGMPQLMAQPDELLAVVSDCALDVSVPHFGLNDADRLAEFLHRWLQQRQAGVDEATYGRGA
ncbi:MAG: molybdopterin-guanine dinucleotide biosynthesis protein B [Anaerolineae bacterium]